jgi:hypothetical protein
MRSAVFKTGAKVVHLPHRSAILYRTFTRIRHFISSIGDNQSLCITDNKGSEMREVADYC